MDKFWKCQSKWLFQFLPVMKDLMNWNANWYQNTEKYQRFMNATCVQYIKKSIKSRILTTIDLTLWACEDKTTRKFYIMLFLFSLRETWNISFTSHFHFSFDIGCSYFISTLNLYKSTETKYSWNICTMTLNIIISRIIQGFSSQMEFNSGYKNYSDLVFSVFQL